MRYARFRNIINHLINQDDMAQEINQVFDKFGYPRDFIDGYVFTDTTNQDIILTLLEEIFDDTQNGWIYYWLYELDHGSLWRPGVTTDINGNDIKLKTIEDLWNLLVAEQAKGEL